MMLTGQRPVLGFVILLLRPYCVYTETEFTVQPKSAAILLGTDLTLDCVARNTPDSDGYVLRYSWMFQNVSTAISVPKALMFNNHSLYIPRLTEADLGEYQCVVQNKDLSTTESETATVLRAYSDSFLLHPKSLVASDGSIISIQCVTGKCAPPPIVHWKKDGILFEGGSQEVTTFGDVTHGVIGQKSMRLKLKVERSSQGLYVCVAKNELTGELIQSHLARLDVKVQLKAPYVDVTELLVRDIMTPEGGSVSLVCPIRGEPEPIYSWTKNGYLFEKMANSVVSTDGTLTMSDIVRSNAGLYRCAGENNLGTISMEPFNVTVAYLDITFKTSPQDVTVTAGLSLSLPCTPPNSYPPARLLWYRDNALFVERPGGQFAAYKDVSGALMFASVQLSDEGTYFCVAQNTWSIPTAVESFPATVSVQASPVLVEPPVATQVTKGRLLRLHCVMTGKPRPTVTWYHNGQALTITDTLSFSDYGQELILRDITKHDEGDYYCVGTNRLGRTESSHVTVTVLVEPEITHGVMNMTATEGATVKLRCVVYGSPQPRVTWYKDGVELKLSGRLRQTSEGLELAYLTGADSGRYRCEANNDAGSRSSEATLLVHVRPTLVSFPSDRRVNQSQLVVMFCDADGVPRPNITWLYNGSESLPEGVTVESQTITISSVDPIHTGRYTCVAANHVGKSNHTAFVLVQVKPFITSITGSTSIDRGDSLEVACHVTGVPQPTVQWTFRRSILHPTIDYRLTFDKDNSMTLRFVTPQDAGEYSCIAQNQVGTDTKEFLVTVRDLPLAPHLSSVRPLSMASVLVTWQSARDVTGATSAYFVIQFKQSNALTFDTFKDDIPAILTSYEVDTLSAAVDYVFRVAMRNDLGRSPYSNVIGARTLENAPSSPRNFQLLSNNATAVKLQWEVPQMKNGEIRTYQVQYRIKFQQEFKRVDIAVPTLPLQRYECATLRPFTMYQWRVRAATIQNSLTLWGNYTEILDVTTSAALPSAGPSSVRLLVQSSSEIDVSWLAIPADSENGVLEGYCVLYHQPYSTGARVEKCVPSGTLHAKLTGLLPWRYYKVTIVAYNNIGRGVESDPKTARTFAEAPAGRPRDVELEALSTSSVRVHWKRLSREQENCDVSGYVVRYAFNGSDSHNLYVANANILTTVINGLRPWSVYSVQVQAFTTQVPHGFGPLSAVKTIRTLASVPGPVTDLAVEAQDQEVTLSWQQPEWTNGIIRQYVVYYSLIRRTRQVVMTTTEETTNEKTMSRQARSLRDGDIPNVSTTETYITVAHLQPASVYVFSVTAETEAGSGPVTNITIQTAPLVSTVAVSSSAVTTAMALLQTDQDEINTDVYEPVKGSGPQLSTPALIGLVIGAAILALLVIALMALLCVRCCCNDRPPQSGVFVLKTDDIISRNTAARPASPSSVNTEERQNVNNDARGRSRAHTAQHSVAQQPWPSQSRHSLRIQGLSGSDVYSPSATLGEGATPEGPLQDRGGNNYHALDWLQQLNPQHLLMREYDEVRPYQVEPESAQGGFANPAYEKDDLNNQGTLPNVTVCNRMRSGSAAAIAVQQTRNSAVFHDTDNLIPNNSIVVYHQRTAL